MLFCLNFKFAKFLSNFELLRTSILRYKNSNFQTRTKFEAIPSSFVEKRYKKDMHDIEINPTTIYSLTVVLE